MANDELDKEDAKTLLNYISSHLEDVKFVGPDMFLFTNDGKIFRIQGFYKKKGEEK